MKEEKFPNTRKPSHWRVCGEFWLGLPESQTVPESHPAMSTSCWTRQGQWPAQAWQSARMAQLPGTHMELSTAVCMWVVIRVGKHTAGHEG